MNILKSEIRNPKSGFQNGIAALPGWPPIHAPQPRKPVCSDFAFRISFGFLPSVFGFFSILFVAFFAPGIQAADSPRPGRYLLIFETSPVLKKNQSELRQTLGKLFSSNLQNELHSGDEVAVWTADRSLHAGVFRMENWTPGDAAVYTGQLAEFIGEQDFTRHASLDGIQPTLNRVVKSSERLTVLIFCDTKSRLSGTSYDGYVNEIITNTAAKSKRTAPLILVLRSYRGEYIGASVNESNSLNFPKFPPPPKPAPPPVVSKPAAVPAPRPQMAQLPPLIVIGTNTRASSAKTEPVSTPTPVPATATNAAALMTPAPVPPPAPAPAAASQPSNSVSITTPAPVQSAPAKPLPTPVPPPPETPMTVSAAVSSPPAVAPANPPVVQSSNTVLSTINVSAAENPNLAWFAAGGALVVAAGFVVWLFTRARRPKSSLITSSMHNDRPSGK